VSEPGLDARAAQRGHDEAVPERRRRRGGQVERLAGQVGEADAGRGGERVAGRQDDDEPLAAQRLGGERLAGRRERAATTASTSPRSSASRARALPPWTRSIATSGRCARSSRITARPVAFVS